MDRGAGQRVIELFEGRGEVEAIRAGGDEAARACVGRARQQLTAVRGAHRITVDIARAALGADASAFSGPSAERFRSGRHEAEYFDPDRPAEKTEQDARWAVALAARAVTDVESAIG